MLSSRKNHKAHAEQLELENQLLSERIDKLLRAEHERDE